MIIKCWGSRGSIPVSGRQYVTYGGDTTCIQITAGSGETVIIDAGTGIRRLGNFLLEQKINRYYMLLTHCHWDHIMGIPFFRPLLYSRNTLIVQDRKFDRFSTKDVFNQVMSSPFFPVGLDDLNADIRFDAALNTRFHIGSLEIDTIPTSHSQGSLGYKFTENGKTFVFLTDNELEYAHPQSRGFDGYKQFSQDADILFHDAEYTRDEYRHRNGWGHSSVPQTLELALKAGAGQLGLIHLNQDRSDQDMDKIVRNGNLFFTSQNSSTFCYGVPSDFEITL
ncbi:MAG: MBL fold metallo-hydrolase [Desulfotignum sp.]|nr:MBL fold metallo-hydrolase [Desulfotignum sp.]MCF8126248.1 MBL fold metallo-hydrolase [Desulfotignum sp.]